MPGSELPDVPDIYYALPPEGGRLTIVSGTTEFDFHRGDIVHANGTVQKMPFSLLKKGFKYLRSLRIDTDVQTNFWLDSGGGKRTIEGNDSMMVSNLEYQVVYVSITATTANIRLWASTSPDALVSDSGAVMLQSATASGGKATVALEGSVTVGVIPTVVALPNAQRKAIMLQNVSVTDVYFGTLPNLTTGTGTKLKTDVIVVDTEYTGAYFVISAAGGEDVRVREYV